MKVGPALKLAKEVKASISSDQAAMYSQDEGSLAFWLMVDKDTSVPTKLKTLEKILAADDWGVTGPITISRLIDGKKKRKKPSTKR